MLLVHQIRLMLQQPEEAAFDAALKKLSLTPSAVRSVRMHKLSVDARRKIPVLIASVAVDLRDPADELKYVGASNIIQVIRPPEFRIQPGSGRLSGPVVVCGLGPAGLFAALELARAGFKPVVLERGPAIPERKAAIEAFLQGGPLDENANIQFGEGGAGTFSDGKLTTRINDPLCSRVIQQLLEAGAPEDISFRAKPHIGTDLLQNIFAALREKLVALGGSVQFNTKLTGLGQRNGELRELDTTNGVLPCGALVLAIGHSARDSFLALHTAGVALRVKPFSVGVRIEHLQSEIDKGLYHEAAGHAALPQGEYALNTRVNGRGVYTFCMCPGGSVVAAASEQNTVVTNGMSLHARSGTNANAAVVANVDEADFGGDPFRAIAFQQSLECAAFAAGGGNYVAPAQNLASFMEGGGSLKIGRVIPTYPKGVNAANLGALLPGDLAPALRAGLRDFGRKLPGFDAPDAILTGLETRTSSPVRMPRLPTYMSESLPGLWPCGEGAGYAGGIMSAAVDGIRVASAIIQRYKAP